MLLHTFFSHTIHQCFPTAKFCCTKQTRISQPIWQPYPQPPSQNFAGMWDMRKVTGGLLQIFLRSRLLIVLIRVCMLTPKHQHVWQFYICGSASRNARKYDKLQISGGAFCATREKNLSVAASLCLDRISIPNQSSSTNENCIICSGQEVLCWKEL